LDVSSISTHLTTRPSHTSLPNTDPITSTLQTTTTSTVLLSTLDSTIRLLDKGTGSLLQSYKGHRNTDYRVRSCLGIGEAYVVSGSEDGLIYAWDLLDGKVVATLEGGVGAGKVVSAVAFHKTQKSFLSAGVDGMLVGVGCVVDYSVADTDVLAGTVAVWGMP
jgi:WD40 repeat protein